MKVAYFQKSHTYSHSTQINTISLKINILDLYVPIHGTAKESSKGTKAKCKFIYRAVSNPQDCLSCLTHYSLADLFYRTPYWLLWKASSHTAINTQWLFAHKYPPLSIAKYSFWAEWTGATKTEKQVCPKFNRVAQYLTPVSLSQVWSSSYSASVLLWTCAMSNRNALIYVCHQTSFVTLHEHC